jgi:hypothetical protein
MTCHRCADNILRCEWGAVKALKERSADLERPQVDNFMFYILTENMYKREHAIGFFSKVSFGSKKSAQLYTANKTECVGLVGNCLLRGLQSGLHRDVSPVSRTRIRQDVDGVQYVRRPFMPSVRGRSQDPNFCTGYYLTRHADSPGTPERPLSELGAIGYESFWIKNVLRTLLVMLIEAAEKEARPDLEVWVKTSREVLKNKLLSGGFLTYHGKPTYPVAR